MRIAVLALVSLAPACGLSSALTTDTPRCAALENRKFEPVDLQGDCGNAPEGAGACHWTLRFERAFDDGNATEFQYHYSDIVESGNARCTLTPQVGISIGTDTEYGGEYNASLDQLTWDGIVFISSPEE